MKIGVVLFNLGGPGCPDEVEPFLRNLFSDPAILDLPGFVRKPLARLIARRRAPVARAIYAKIGGRSPILEETEKQARALQSVLSRRGYEAQAFIAMRCSAPSSLDAARAAKAWGAERIVLLPLYPQYSTTTTASSLAAWKDAARHESFAVPHSAICCYPLETGFVEAMATGIAKAFAGARPGLSYRLLLSAHGLPERVIRKGDPYRWQTERTAKAIVDALGMKDLDWRVCYQSRVGPLPWIGPHTDTEIEMAGGEGKGVIVAPIAFVSEHSETLVELDIEYAALACGAGVADYKRVAVAGTDETFIAGLAGLVERALQRDGTESGAGVRLCPQEFRLCGFGGALL